MVAARTEENKKIKYSNVVVVGTESMAPLREIGCRLWETMIDDMTFIHFLQRLSVAVQQSNAASVVGTVTAESCSGFFNIL